MTEKNAFNAEISALFDLIAKHLYSNSDAFVRELISNSSDANDKFRILALKDAKLDNGDALGIWLEIDEAENTLIFRDNGIGMSLTDAKDHLGTIARSGTKAFMEKLESAPKEDQKNMIGQFGVGFYSAFVVADEVIVQSRRADLKPEEGIEWRSVGKGEYEIKPLKVEARGTKIILKLKEEHKDYTNDWKLRQVITKYSDHLPYPVHLKFEQKNDKGDIDVKEDVVNQAKALWAKHKKDITDEQYEEFYKHISHDFEAPLSRIHYHIEGSPSFKALLYLPKRAPMDLWSQDGKRGLKLFVERVFIMDNAEQFLPSYLRFVKGVVDSSDLPLNVSRELLQSNKVTETIKATNTKRILSLLDQMAAKEPEKYQEFYKEFGSILKEGPGEDFANQERIAKLLRFASTKTEETTVSLSDYVASMKPEQESIYYIIADNYRAGKCSPNIEVYQKKDIDVLILSDRVDEWLMARLPEFEGKKFVNISQGKVDIEDSEEEKLSEEDQKSQEDFIKKVKDVLGDRVKDVRSTNRLTESPSCVVADDQEMTPNLKRILREAGQVVPESKLIFELNMDHPLVNRLMIESNEAVFEKRATLMHMQALLLSGEELNEPDQFVKIMNDLLIEG